MAGKVEGAERRVSALASDAAPGAIDIHLVIGGVEFHRQCTAGDGRHEQRVVAPEQRLDVAEEARAGELRIADSVSETPAPRRMKASVTGSMAFCQRGR